jgi:hypothetical protein
MYIPPLIVRLAVVALTGEVSLILIFDSDVNVELV